MAKELDYNEEDNAKDYLTFLTVRSLHKKIYKAERFDEACLLIIDFDMPQGDGLSFIDQLTNERLKKILLTGVANNDQALDAFNKGTIDRYVKKMNNDYDIQLKQYAQELQANYFCDASRFLLEDLPELLQVLKDPALIKFFNEFVKTHRIKEFYLLEESGSFLMIAYDESMSILCLQSKSDQKDIIGDLRLRDDLKESDIEPIIQGQKLTTYLFTNSEKSNGNMKNYFFDCNTIEGTEINYAHIPDVDVLNLDLSRIKFRAG
jgi:CheY-like chemotaxis protein